MNTLPAKWYIPVTPENYDEVKSWWLTQVEKSGWYGRYLDNTFIVLSAHPNDKSHYWVGNESYLNQLLPSYKKITLEQFRQITNPTQKPMTKSIQIPHSLLIEYYKAATTHQKEYLNIHFKLDGTTTDEAIRGLYDLACWDWKPRIKKNHPECFAEESKHFDFSGHVEINGYASIIPEDTAESLGINYDFIQVMHNPKNEKTHCRSFCLDSDYNWELIKDGGDTVLIPTKK